MSENIECIVTMEPSFKPEIIASDDETRPQLTVVHFAQRGEGFVAVATDGHAMTLVTCKVEGFTAPFSIPATVIAQVRKALGKRSVVTFAVKGVDDQGEFSGTVTIPNMTIAVRTLGQFPPYERIVPTMTENARTITLSVDLLLKCAKSIGASMENLVTLTLGDSELDPIRVSTPSSESFAVQMPCRK